MHLYAHTHSCISSANIQSDDCFELKLVAITDFKQIHFSFLPVPPIEGSFFFFFISLYFSQHCSTVQNVCDRESINHSTVSSEIYSMPNCYIRLDYLQVNLFLNKQQVGRPLYKLNTFHYLFSLKLEK